MKSTAPWSVKGIERDAREAAKDAARREGLTVGEWLNRTIYTAGEGGFDGEIDGLRLKDLATALSHLSERLADTEQKSDDRLERLENAAKGGVLAADPKTAQAQAQQTAAIQRLEQALGQAALQFNAAQKNTLARMSKSEQALVKLAQKVAADSAARQASGGDAAAEGATGGADAEFVENTGKKLRVLGDEIKRSGDQIRTLEGSIEKLGEHIEAAERRSAVGIEKVAETIAALRNELIDERKSDNDPAAPNVSAELAELAERTETRVSALQEAFQSIVDRLDRLSGAPLANTVQPTEPSAETRANDPLSAFDLSGTDADDAASARDNLDAPAASDTAPEATSQPTSQEPTSQEHAALLADVQAVFGLSGDANDETTSSAEPAPVETSTSFSAPAVTGGQAAAEGDARDAATAAQDDDIDDLMAELDALGFGGDNAGASAEAPSNNAETAQAEDQEDPFSGGLEDDADTDAFEADETFSETDPASDINLGETSLGDASLDLNITLPGEETADADAHDDFPPLEQAADHSPQDEPALAGAGLVARAAEQDTGGPSEPPPPTPKARRRLSPRQRAILQEKIRRKRVAAAHAARGGAEAPEQDGAPLEDAVQPTPAQETEAPANVRRSLLQTGRSLLGGAQTTETAETTQDNGDEAPSVAAGAPVLSNLNVITNRPLTAALGGAIVLSTAALVFSMRDYFFTNDASSSVSASAAPSIDEPTENIAAETPAIEETVTLAPRDLFLEAMTGLSAAGTPEIENEALGKLQQAAALGHPPAQLQLGEFYKLGQLVEADARQARTWYQRSANGGNVLAMHRLGVMAARGEGGAVDLETSITWFERAANLGLIDSQYNLGATYHPTGDGAASRFQDRAKAYYWYSIAGANGDDQALALASGLANGLTEDQRTRLDKEIAEWTALPRDPSANERPGA